VVSLVNHAEDANAGVWQEYERELVVLEALRPIAAGEEITIHYDVELWFDAV
jgi:SET domain-containing protein